MIRKSAPAVAIAAVLLATACTTPTSDTAASRSGSAPSAEPTTPASAASTGGVAAAAARLTPSVVTVNIRTPEGGGNGSGVVYRDGGYLITNEHVVRGATSISLTLADATRTNARLVAADPITDIAVLQAGRRDLPAARFATALPQVGQAVLTVGSPLGFTNTVSAGIVSGLGRAIPGAAAAGSLALVDLIQTDAAISPGNSGGALADHTGAVIGINEAYISPQAGAVDLGFAIPAATALDVAEELRTTGRARHAFTGLTPATVTADIARDFNLPVPSGVLATKVTADGPADRAGITPGAIITELADQPTPTVEAFLSALRRLERGQAVPVRFVAPGQQDPQTATITLAERP
jgi:S1-C subfamily serine protease